MALYKSPLEIELMRRIKVALDPLELMNPGKVLPPASMKSNGPQDEAAR